MTLLFTGTVFAKAPAKKLTQRDKANTKVKRKVEDDTVIELLRKYNNDIRRSLKDKKALSSLQYSSFVSAIGSFVEYRWFMADTGLSKKWLKKVQEILAYMSKTQSYLEAAKFNGRTETAKYKQAVKYFNTTRKRFAKSIEKPVKVSAKVRRKAQTKRNSWERAMRKKYKIKKQAIRL